MQNTKDSVVVLLSGSGSNFQAIIDASKNNELDIKIKAVISNIPGVKGLERANRENIPSKVINNNDYSSRSKFEKSLLSEIKKYSPKYIILAGFMRVLSSEFIDNFNGVILNIHPSLLPKFPGLNTHKRALEANEEWHGCTVHIVTKELDAGPPIIQCRVPIKKDDDDRLLASRVLIAEHLIYKKAIKLMLTKQLIYRNNKLISLNEDLITPVQITLE
jgi:phosphoribosylglycinamide formyltransferase-1